MNVCKGHFNQAAPISQPELFEAGFLTEAQDKNWEQHQWIEYGREVDGRVVRLKND